MRQQTLSQRESIADAIASEAKSIAPVLEGDYRGGMHVTVSGTTVMVVDTDEAAIHKEYGTADTPAHASLTNAALKHGKYQGMRPR